MSISGRFFDESKIVKKTSAQPIQQSIPAPVIETPLQSEPVQKLEVEEKQKKPRKKKEEAVTQQSYEEMVQRVIAESPEAVPEPIPEPGVTIIMQPKKPDKPVYHYSMGEDGKAVVTPLGRQEEPENLALQIEQEPNNKREKQLMQMLDKTEDEIVRLAIELDIHIQVGNLIPARKQVFENKVRNIQDDLEYNQKRKVIIEKMLFNR